MSLSPQWLDELRARVSLSAVIGRTTRLTKAGREFKACCPFHNEKSPSFTVNDEKGFYHCFGCGAHGDVIRWMTDQRGLAFMDAVRELAGEAGMELPAPDPRGAQAAEQRDSLHDVMAAAQAWFVERLHSDEGAAARAYLAKRGFNERTVERFGFGYAPEGRQALKAALARFPEALLIEAGLRIAVEEKEPYDRFRGRLMLPIEDARGRVIAFGGRILDNARTDAPKYLNSPDTPLFDKGRTLYNFHRAGPAARRSGRLIVVEGYMDVIALAAAGIEEAVAPLGTALTENQLGLLWRVVETPVLCFDGDAAGQRAAMRAALRALPLLKPAHSLRIVTLPAGMDPDDLVKRDGAAAMERLIGEARPLADLLWGHERDALPLVTPEDKAGLKARLLTHVETIADQDIRALYRRELNSRFSAFAFPPRDWSQHGNKVRDIRTAPSKPSRNLAEKHSSWTRRERYLHRRLGAAIAGGLLRWTKFVAAHAETIVLVEDAEPRLLAIADAYLDVGGLDCGQLETILAENGLEVPIATDWDGLRFPFTWPPADEQSAETGLRKAMRLYAGLPQVRKALAAATARVEADLDEQNWAEQQRLLKRALAFEAELRQMAAA
jgi:DNA primase